MVVVVVASVLQGGSSTSSFKNFAASIGFVQREVTSRLVGFAVHSNRWDVVCDGEKHSGQIS